MDAQNTVFVVGRRLSLIDVVDVERTAHAALAALAADVVALFVLLIFRLLVLRGNRQVVVLVGQGDVFLLEPRQLRREVVALAVVFDIDLEVGHVEALHERFVKDIHQAIEHVFVLREFTLRCKWNQTKHDQNPLSMSRRRSRAGWYLLVASSGRTLRNPSACAASRFLSLSPFPLDIYRIAHKSQKVNRSNKIFDFFY